MEQVSAWVGVGLVTAGVSAALLAGAGIAGADTESGSDAGASSQSRSESTSSGGSTSAGSAASGGASAGSAGSETTSKPGAKDDDRAPGDTDTSPDDADDTAADSGSDSGPVEEPEPVDTVTAPEPVETPGDAEVGPAETEPPRTASPTPVPARHDDQNGVTTATPAKKAVDVVPVVERDEPVAIVPETTVETAVRPVPHDTTADSADSIAAPAPVTTRLARAAAAAVAPPAPPSLLDVVGSVIAAVVVNVGSLVINTLQALEALVQGPPVLPAGSTVTVRSSTLELGTGQRVAANWYYPEGDEVPTRMILLQHGLLALGPMYSYTAANLVAQTNSIVVTPSLPSNLFAGDAYWLGGTGMASAVADLFIGDRAALTRSALDAGFADRYGVDPRSASLPTKFAMAGHSLGGNLVAAAAGFLAANGGAANLVGVITLDGVPTGSTMADALGRLDAYESRGGQYVPIREIGAPWNVYNSLSNVKEALDAARPDRFNGVVLAGGVHMDSMQGGNPLIQFAAYVAAGFPQPQNPPAVQQLAVTWLQQWFDGDTAVGDDLEPGSTIQIPTSAGVALGTVVGTPRPRTGLADVRAGATGSGPSALPDVGAALARLTA